MDENFIIQCVREELRANPYFLQKLLIAIGNYADFDMDDPS